MILQNSKILDIASQITQVTYDSINNLLVNIFDRPRCDADQGSFG